MPSAGAATWRAQSQTVKPQIVGGTVTSIQSAPWQVRIRARTDGQAWGTPVDFKFESCGGSIIDATHIVTAQHCTIDPTTNTDIPPLSYTIDAGFSRFDASNNSLQDPAPQPGDRPQNRKVLSVRRHSGYGRPAGAGGSLVDLKDDVAVLTLATPLNLDDPTTVAPIALADPGPSPIGNGTATGFGLQADGAPAADGNFYSLTTPIVDSSLSEDQGGAAGLNALYAVSLSAAGSTCQGDSGGPLVQDGKLVGIVSSGAACGGGTPSYYTNVSAPEIRDFITGNDTPPLAPQGGQDATLSGPSSPRVGDTLTCSAGTWSNAPAFTYVFSDAGNGTVYQSGPTATYVLAAATEGRTVSCRALATTTGGTGRTPTTGATPAIAAAPKAPTPAPTPSPSPSPTPAKPSPAKFASPTFTSGSTRVKQGSRVSFRITVRNTGDVAAKNVRICARISSSYSIVSRGGAKLTGGRLCWTISQLGGQPLTRARVPSTVTKRFSLRADRDAKTGRHTAATVSITAPGVRSVSARRLVTIQRRAAAPSPGGVTG